MRYVFAALVVLCTAAPSMAAADLTLAAGVTVAPGETAALALVLTTPAPAGGVSVSLSSSDTAKVKVNPENVYIPGGSTTSPSQPRVTGVAFGSATISASAYGLIGTSTTVQVSSQLSGPASQTIQRGSTVNVTFALSSPTPTALTLAVSSDNPGVASVPPSVTIPANGSFAVVPVGGVGGGSTTIHVSALPAIAESTVSITVIVPASITLSPVSIALGGSAPFPVTLGTPAPAGGVTVTLTSSSTKNVLVSPGSVFIPAGASVPAVQPQVIAENIGVATITASAPGYLSASQEVPVTATITVPPTMAIPVGSSRLLSIAFSASATPPVYSDPNLNGFTEGVTLQLSSSNPSVAWLQPTLQVYGDGSNFTIAVVVVNGAAAGTAVIHVGAPPYIPEVTTTVTVGSGGTGPASSITAMSGTPQTTAVSTPFGLPLAVTVRDSAANPVSGVAVTFTAPASGPSATFANGVNTATTDASGVARSQTLTANAIAGTYQVTATVAGVASTAGFTLTNSAGAPGSITLPGGVSIGVAQSAAFPVTLTAPAPSGGVTVVLSSSDASKVSVAPLNVFIAAGATTPASQPQVTGVNFGSATISASASGYTSASQSVQVAGALSFSPATITISGPGTQNLTLALTSAAPAGGLNVSLSSSNPSVAGVAGSASIAAGATSVSVPVSAGSAGSATITATASAPNVTSATANVSVTAISADMTLGAGVTVSPGESALLPLFLKAPAPDGGVWVSLTSSDESKVRVSPPNIYIPGGATTPALQPRVTGVDFGSATISASAYGLTGASQTVQVSARLTGPAGETIQRGSTVNATFALSSPTPTALTVTVKSDNPGVASVPASVTIPVNGSVAVVPIAGVAAGSTTVRVSAPPTIAESTVAISVVTAAGITLSPVSVPLGESAPFPITLGTPAPSGGVFVTLSSSSPGNVTMSQGTVFVPAGATVPAVQARVIGNNIGVSTITVSAPGYLSASQQVPVTGTVTLSPQPLVIQAGSMRLLSIALSAAAGRPVYDTPGGYTGFVEGITLQLSSSNPSVATLQPTLQVYSDGSNFTTVVVLVSGVAPGTAVIHVNALPYIPDVTATVIVQ